MTSCLASFGRLAITGGGRSARVWEVAKRRRRREVKVRGGGVDSIAVPPDGRLALTGSGDHGGGGSAFLVELTSGCRVRRLKADPRHATGVALTPDARLALTGGGNGTAYLWELSSGRCLHTLDARCEVLSVALASDGRLGLTGGADGTARVWNLADGRCLRRLEGHSGPARIALTPDGRLAITGDSGGSLRVWELPEGRCLHTFEAHPGGVESVALTPDGRFALTGGVADRTARLWELDWDYEFPEPADWDEGARGLLAAFLHGRVPYAERLIEDGPLRSGVPVWDEPDFGALLHTLQDAGYGWLWPEGVRKQLERMVAAWPDEPGTWA